MSHKRLLLIAILLSEIGLTGLQAQTMYVKQTNGSQTAYAMSNIKKLTFSSGNVTVQKTDNSTGVYLLGGLQYLSFIDYGVGISEMSLTNALLQIYPNPVNNLLNVDLSGVDNTNGTLKIFSIDGRLLHSQPINGSGIETIDLRQFPKGIYLCIYKNSTEIKTAKIIKQ